MHVTLVELEFTELPSLPGAQAAMQKSYLLSMWDCTCRIATWDASTGCFEDSGGQLNPLAIRSWALLPQPLDAEAWGESIVRAALSGDMSRNNAGWLQPKYQPQCAEESGSQEGASLMTREINFQTASSSEITARLDALHAGTSTGDCGNWSADGAEIRTCDACSDFTLRWLLAARSRPELRDINRSP